MVDVQTDWLDVGCGRSIFPANAKLARILADRCRLLVGVDPDDTLDENPYVHERVKQTIGQYRSDRRFQLVTLRMVAEHITDPVRVVSNLARLTESGGRVVVYTIFRWSPVPVVTHIVPFRFHHWIKKTLWGTEERDTFPTVYRMNTRGALARYFGAAGFEESTFSYLDDCRTFGGFRILNFIELCTQKALRSIGLHYPEMCILGVYRRV